MRQPIAARPPSALEDTLELRRQLIAIARTTIARGLNVTKSGNVSARCMRGGPRRPADHAHRGRATASWPNRIWCS